MEKPSGRKPRQSRRPPRLAHSFTDRLAPHIQVNVQQSTHDMCDSGIADHQPARDSATHNVKQEIHTGDRHQLVLQPDSSVEGGPETAALYCKFPTFFNKEQLYDHIQKHGFGKNVVAIDMHYRKFTKTPAGSAKVSIVPPALMEAFIEALHGTCLPGEFQQLLSVQPYVQKEDQSHKVFVGSGLPHTVTQEDIQKHFVKLKDEITNVEIKTEKKRNTCYVLIAFRSRTAAKQAVDIYHHTIFLEKRIKVEMYQPQHMMRTLSPTPNMYAAKSTTGSKVRQRDANSKDETYTDNSVSKSSAHYSSAMSTKLKRGYSHANIHLKSQQKSISKYTDKRKKSSTVIVIAENLDPKFSIIDLEYLTNVKIDNYTPSHLTPDKAAAWIEVSNDMDARIIADCLNERIIVGREIHCSMAKSTALYKLMTRREAKAHVPCSIISKAIHVNHHPLPVAADGSSCPQIMETDMKEMACHQPLASISPISPQCSMLPIIDVKTINLQQGLWKYLTTRQQDGTTLLQQFIAPFSVHPNVDIMLQWQVYTIRVSGIPNAVTNAYNYISDQVDKYLYVEDRVKMSALVYLNPSLQQALSSEHGVTISGFDETSFVIKFDGIPSAVRAARKVIDDILSKAIITNVQCTFSKYLLLVAQKQLEAEQCKVYFSSQLNMSDNTDSLIVTVCSFDEKHHCVAVTLLNMKEPIVDEVKIPPLTISNDGFTQQLKQLEDNFCVLIKEQKLQDINIRSKQIVITGFCPSRVNNAHSSIVSLLKLYSEHHVKLECKPEEVIYLCKVDKESESILASLPVKLSIKGAEIIVTGNHDCIVQSKELIINGLLLHLQFKSYTYECRHTGIFISLIKDFILEPFADENKIQYYIEKRENNGHNDGNVSCDPKIEGFQIIIYSRHEHVFSKVCCEMESLTPKIQLFQLYCEEAMHFVRKGMKVFEEKYRVRVILDDNTCELTIHGLTLDEIQQCWKQIDDEVESNVESTKNIPLKRYEFLYLQKKQRTKLKQSFSCEITFPQHGESEKNSVCIQGKIKDVKPAASTIADLLANIQMIKFSVQCKSSLMNMWRMWWHDIITQQQEKHDVIIQSDYDIVDSSKHRSSIIPVSFEVIGTDIGALKCIESTLCDEEVEERVIHNTLKVNTFLDVTKLSLFGTFPIAISDINQCSDIITVVSPKSLSSNLDIAEEEIIKFFELHADISKEISFEDPIFQLILLSPVMLNNYTETIKDIAGPEKVEVHVSKQMKLKLTGNPLAVKKVESLIYTRFINEIESTNYPVSSNHAALLATNEFLHFQSELQNNYCITLSYTKPRCSSKVLHIREIKSPSRFAHSLQLSICYGSIVYEEVDAIVNPTNEYLKQVSGIAKSIVIGGGATIQHESDEHVQVNGKVAIGTCVCLGAGELPCKRVIHVVLPDCHEENCEEQIIYDTIIHCLQCADEEKLKTVALPAIGTGIFGISEEVCAHTSMRAVYDYCQSILISNISAVKFVLRTPDSLKQFSLAYKSVFQSVTEENAITFESCEIVWLWKNDDGSYSHYTPEISAKLTNEYKTNPSGSLTCEISKRTYRVDFSCMIQTNISTGFRRDIRHIIINHPTITAVPSNQAAQWMYMDNDNCWSHYTSHDSQIVEKMYRNDLTVNTELQIRGNKYMFDFKQMVQINVKTRHKRKIVRIEKRSLSERHTATEGYSDSNDSESQLCEYHQVMSNERSTITLRGLKNKVHEAKGKLHEKLTSLYASSDPLFIPFALKAKSCQIAEQYNVIWSIEKEDSRYKDKIMLKLTLRGLATDVQHARTTIKKEMDAYDDCDVYPEEWENLSDGETTELQLFKLKRGTNEWNCVERKFTTSMSEPCLCIIQITRIQNTCLWRKYTFEKKTMSERNNGEINELDLFHGTRKNLPQQIYESRIGFDSRHSNYGLWGQANYFAQKASYSDAYAHKTTDGMKEMFLVKVLTGESCEHRQDSKLRIPPFRSREDGSRLLEQYDSITGWTDDHCKVYMTYDNNKAYPAYLIKYKTS